MSSAVSAQIDIGAFTLQGLASFAPVLAALSADNVVPLAMVQMENLGSCFHINGNYVQKVPDLLQRYSSVRLDRVGVCIGWRKGDAASLMATSAGGQAISLLSTCLLSLYKPSIVGSILYGLSEKLLTSTIAIASVSQLLGVAKLTACKLEALGFGNVLAQQVTKINKAYVHLGKPVPCDFLDDLSEETTVEILYSISQALQGDSTIVRITGSQGMGHIIGLAMIMFPQDTYVTLEDMLIAEGLRKSILIEFTTTAGPTQIQIELT